MTDRRTLLILVVAALAVVVGAGNVAAQDVGSDTTVGQDGEATDLTGQSSVTIDVGAGDRGFKFNPADVRIDAGTTVRWVWTGRGSQHNVVEADGEQPLDAPSFESQLTAVEGHEFTHTFEEAGTYDYVCSVHLAQDMIGSIEVVENTDAGNAGDRERNMYDSPGDGEVYLGPAGERPTVFQGEANIEFVDPNTDDIVDQLVSTYGEQRILDIPITTSGQLGTYTIDGNSGSPGVVLQEPEVTDIDILDSNGEIVNTVTQNNVVAVGIDFNYGAAEPLHPEVFNDRGVDVTSSYLLAAGPRRTGLFTPPSYGNALSNLNAAQTTRVQNEAYDYLISANFDDSGSFEVSAGPDGDLADVDAASQSEVLQVVRDYEAELGLDQNTAIQGEEVDFEVSNSEDGDIYHVAVEADNRRDDNTAATTYPNPFVNVGDTESTGFVNGYYYAQMEVDGTSAVGRIDTEPLDDTGVEVSLYDTNDVSKIGSISAEEAVSTLNIQQAEISIDSPPRAYVPGQEISLNGTVSEGVDEVSAFVQNRDEGKYFHITNITVDDADNTYEEVNFLPTSDAQTASARDILGQPGVYRYGVVDTLDVLAAQNDPGTNTTDPFEDGPDAGLSSFDFASGASVQQPLRVAEPSLEADFVTFDDGVYKNDGIGITGTLVGPRPFVVLLTDSDGNTIAQAFNANRDGGEIDEEIRIDSLSSGEARASVISPGRDGVFGDGTFQLSEDLQRDTGLPSELTATISNYLRLANELGNTDRSRSQIREILLSETVEDIASDDLLIEEGFSLSDDSSTSITDVLPAQQSDELSGINDIEVGETMVVRGTTNRNPDDATVVVEAVEGPSLIQLGTAVTDSWSQDGVWEVTIPVTEEVEPGIYTIQSDDGNVVNQTKVEIISEDSEDGSDLRVSDVRPDGVDVASEIEVVARIENVGGRSGTQTAEFRLDVDQDGVLEQDEKLAEETVTVGAGDTEKVTFEDISTAGLVAGTYTHGVFTDNDSTTATMTVGQDRPPTETATVSAGSVNIPDVGDTAETTVSIDASGGISGVDVTVSVDNPNVEIADASVAEQPGGSQTSIEDQTANSVNISYTDVTAGSRQVDLADVRFRATGDIQNQVDINLDAPYARVGGANNLDITTDSGTITGGNPVGNATVESGGVALQTVGETGDSAITVDAQKGLSAADVTVSVDTSVATITDIQPGSDVDSAAASIQFSSEVGSRGGSATISYTDVSAASGQLEGFELATVELEAQTDDGQTPLSVESQGLFGPSGGFYSVRTSPGTVTAGGVFSASLIPEFGAPPTNTDELDQALYEDLDGDGDGTEVDPTVTLFGELIRGEDLGLTGTQVDRLDWDRDNGDSVDIDDMVALFGRQIRAG